MLQCRNSKSAVATASVGLLTCLLPITHEAPSVEAEVHHATRQQGRDFITRSRCIFLGAICSTGVAGGLKF